MIDWERVAQLRDGLGPDDFSEVVALFFEEVAEALARLAATGDAALRRDDLHFLKGSALNLGFTALSELCGAAERQVEGADMAAILQCYGASRDSFLGELGLRAVA